MSLNCRITYTLFYANSSRRPDIVHCSNRSAYIFRGAYLGKIQARLILIIIMGICVCMSYKFKNNGINVSDANAANISE